VAVYFLQMQTPDGEGPIKIGFSRHPGARAEHFRFGSPYPLVLLAETPGARDEEREYHERFAHARLGGEWFKPVPELVAEVDGIVGLDREELRKQIEREQAARDAALRLERRRKLCDEYLDLQRDITFGEWKLELDRQQLVRKLPELHREGIGTEHLDGSALANIHFIPRSGHREQMIEAAIGETA
jgi:hypothetical protein